MNDNVITPEQAAKNLERWWEKVGEKLLDTIKRRTPVLTGKLRDGFDINVREETLEITNDVEYCDAVENGTYKQAPVGMVKTSLNDLQAIGEQTAGEIK